MWKLLKAVIKLGKKDTVKTDDSHKVSGKRQEEIDFRSKHLKNEALFQHNLLKQINGSIFK